MYVEYHLISSLMITITGRLWFPLFGQLDCQQGAVQGRLTLDPMEESERERTRARINDWFVFSTRTRPWTLGRCRTCQRYIKTWKIWGEFGLQRKQAAENCGWSLSFFSVNTQELNLPAKVPADSLIWIHQHIASTSDLAAQASTVFYTFELLVKQKTLTTKTICNHHSEA